MAEKKITAPKINTTVELSENVYTVDVDGEDIFGTRYSFAIDSDGDVRLNDTIFYGGKGQAAAVFEAIANFLKK
jgi:hypothetical protein